MIDVFALAIRVSGRGNRGAGFQNLGFSLFVSMAWRLWEGSF